MYLELSIKPLVLISKLPETYESYRVSIPQNVFISNRKREKNPQKKEKGRKMSNVKQEMNQVIQELQDRGIDMNAHMQDDVTGLGDVIESALQKFGITEERFKTWFGLQECGCSKRKKWLNGLFSWKKNK